MTSDLCLDTALLLHTSPETPYGRLECLVPLFEECVVWRWQDPNDNHTSKGLGFHTQGRPPVRGFRCLKESPFFFFKVVCF